MNKEDIIRMAQEAGLEDGWAGWCQECGCDSDKLTRFAALVAAAEREACARVAEMSPDKHYCAATIRARGQK